jgi:lysozyme
MATIKTRLAVMGAGAILSAAGSLAYYFEGEIFKTYVDPVGVLTACVGHTGQDVALGQFFTEKQCTELFIKDLRAAEKSVNLCIPKLPETMKPAIISFTFNVGEGALCKSTLAKYANAAQYWAACGELRKWNKAGGKVLPGLVRRREAEYKSCVGGL